MARRYRKLEPHLWYDEKFAQLNPTEKLIFLYCLCGPQTNRIGCYVLSPSLGAENCGITPETFRKGFDNVRETFGWHWCNVTRTLFIPTWWRYQKPDNPNAFSGCLKDLDELPQSLLVEEFKANVVDLPVTFRKRLANVTPNVSPQEQEQEQEQEKRKTTTSSKEKSVGVVELEGEELRGVRKWANRVRQAQPSLERDWVWQSLALAAGIDPGLPADIGEAITSGRIERPRAYAEKILRENLGINTPELRERLKLIPVPPAPQEVQDDGQAANHVHDHGRVDGDS